MRSDDLTTLLTGHRGQPDVGFRQGRVISLNPQTGTNTVEVAGQVFTDLPVLAASAVTITAGDVVGLLRYKSTYLVLGRINTVGNQHGNFITPGLVGLSTTQRALWPSTTSGTFEELWSGWVRRSGTEFAFFTRTYLEPNTNGEFACFIDGEQVASETQQGGAGGLLGQFTFQDPWPGETDWTNAHTITFHARRTAGAGKVAMVVQGLLAT